MRYRRTKLTGLAGALAVFTACGGGPTGTNSGDPLTMEEIQALFNAMAQAYAEIGVGGGSGSPQVSVSGFGLQLTSVPVNADFNHTVSCQSGELSVKGSMDGDVDQEQFTGDISINFQYNFDACVVGVGTTTITVNGDPYIEFSGKFVFTENEISISGTEVGGFRYTTSDDRGGSCAIDVSFSSSVDLSTNGGSVEISGSVCGISADSFTMVVI